LIGPETYEQRMATRMEKSVGQDIHDLTLGDTVFHIKQLVQQVHTKGDLVVYLPQKKVFFAGDLVFNAYRELELRVNYS